MYIYRHIDGISIRIGFEVNDLISTSDERLKTIYYLIDALCNEEDVDFTDDMKLSNLERIAGYAYKKIVELKKEEMQHELDFYQKTLEIPEEDINEILNKASQSYE
jgi:uncharacterized protein with ParB-like and HNH nuclease domain